MRSNYDPLYKPFTIILPGIMTDLERMQTSKKKIALLVWKAKQELDTRTAYNVPKKLYHQYSEALQGLIDQIRPGHDNPETVIFAEQARKYLEKRMLYRVRIKNRVY